MPQIWANYLLQQTGTSVAPSAGWINPGDVLQRRGSGATSTVVAVIPDPSGLGPCDPNPAGQPGRLRHARPARGDDRVRRAGELRVAVVRRPPAPSGP